MLTIVLGTAHGLASALAMILGAIVVLGAKGTARHRQLGQIYVIAVVFVGVTSLGIYRLNRFWFPHWFALATIAVVGLAWCAAHYRWPTRSSWLYVHLTSMLISYYFLWGGAVNEAFLHVAALRDLAPRAKGIAIASSHSIVMIVFAVWILWTNAFHAGRRVREAAR
jgi:uncharacterized membrane protein